MNDSMNNNGRLLAKKNILYAVLTICALPLVANTFGIDFGTVHEVSDVNDNKEPYHLLSGAFVHTLLEWTAFCLAIFTALLSLLQFYIKKNAINAIIALSLITAGCMDAFHTLAADHLIQANVASEDFIPFTWALCRVFNALILLAGVGMILARKDVPFSPRSITFVALLFSFIAYVTIQVCSSLSVLPQTMYENSVISRPWDIVALVLFVASAFVFGKFCQKTRSLFAYTLFLSVVPSVLTQLYMIFGSSSLFDNNFNVAHFLKIVAYAVPCAGLMADYVHTYKQQMLTEHILIKDKQLLEKHVQNLEPSRKMLEDFTYLTSHELKAPVRAIYNHCRLLKEDDVSRLSEKQQQRIARIQHVAKNLDEMIASISYFSQMDSIYEQRQIVNLTFLVEKVAQSHNVKVQVEDLPQIICCKKLIRQLFSELISNGMKYNRSAKKIVYVGFCSPNIFYVRDNGIGIDKAFFEKIFVMFKRLHNEKEYSGKGVGLTIAKKIVELHGGKIWVESTLGTGSTFYFTLRRK